MRVSVPVDIDVWSPEGKVGLVVVVERTRFGGDGLANQVEQGAIKGGGGAHHLRESGAAMTLAQENTANTTNDVENGMLDE